jgi:hypothetical protein
MPPLLTQVARVSDGLPLVATHTPAPGIPVSNREQQEAKEILKKITSGYVRFMGTVGLLVSIVAMDMGLYVGPK